MKMLATPRVETMAGAVAPAVVAAEVVPVAVAAIVQPEAAPETVAGVVVAEARVVPVPSPGESRDL